MYTSESMLDEIWANFLFIIQVGFIIVSCQPCRLIDHEGSTDFELL